MARLVVDTNSLLRSLSRKSEFHDFWVSLFDGRNILCVSNEILDEYEEILQLKTTRELASLVIKAIINNPYTEFISIYYSFELIATDTDDNKFVDCAVAANARYVVTNDRHFDVLKSIEFPKVDIITLEEILAQL